jgi:DNA polymerase III subunit alpha
MNNSFEYLKKLVYQGATNKNLEINDNILDRINYELTVINELGYTDYFILYARIVKICNKLNLLRTLGRNTAPHSLINYFLDITKINPIDENLIFERFLNIESNDTPDIDLDIPTGCQIMLIEKLKEKYPEYHTCFIALLPSKVSNYKKIINNDNVYDKHPFGVLITKERLNKLLFNFEGQEYYLIDEPMTDPFYDSKIDILELYYLNKLQKIVDKVGAEHHPYNIKLNDPKVFNIFASGDLGYIFYFSNPNLKQHFIDFKPNSTTDLSIIYTMILCGLQKYIPTLIHNKFHNSKSHYSSDLRVSNMLKETYGLLIYQETFLHLCKEIAGIPYTKTVIWRKKILKDSSNYESLIFNAIFAKGCKKHSSLSRREIVSLINVINEMFSFMGPKSHALCYSTISYWGAYYKTYFRKQFDEVFEDY